MRLPTINTFTELYSSEPIAEEEWLKKYREGQKKKKTSIGGTKRPFVWKRSSSSLVSNEIDRRLTVPCVFSYGLVHFVG